VHPVVVRQDGTLIAGERRIEAFKKLVRTDIPVTIVDLDDIVRGEYAENTQRKPFTPSEMVAIEPQLKAEAKKPAGLPIALDANERPGPLTSVGVSPIRPRRPTKTPCSPHLCPRQGLRGR